MDREIKIFQSAEFGEVRTMTDERGEPWFVGKDIATVLGYANPTKAIISHVDAEDKLHSQIGNAGQMRDMLFINESGLYSLILSSKLPQAREFKRWVTSVVLPQIRKTGGYIPVQQDDDEQTILCKALGIMKRTIEEKDTLIAQHERLIEEKRPKVMFAEAVTSSDDSILIRDLAKLITQKGVEIGQQRLFHSPLSTLPIIRRSFNRTGGNKYYRKYDKG